MCYSFLFMEIKLKKFWRRYCKSGNAFRSVAILMEAEDKIPKWEHYYFFRMKLWQWLLLKFAFNIVSADENQKCLLFCRQFWLFLSFPWIRYPNVRWEKVSSFSCLHSNKIRRPEFLLCNQRLLYVIFVAISAWVWMKTTVTNRTQYSVSNQ